MKLPLLAGFPALLLLLMAEVALTAFAREWDRKGSINAGFDDHLAQPLEAEALLRKVAGRLARK